MLKKRSYTAGSEESEVVSIPASATRPVALHKARQFVAPYGFLAAIGILSALTFLSLGRAPDQVALIQFLKGLLDLALILAASVAILCHLSNRPLRSSSRMLRIYLAGAAISSAYCVAEVICAYYGFDLGKAIFGSISKYPAGFDRTAPFFYQWDIFFRAVGFAGVDAQAIYSAGAFVLLVVARPFKRAVWNNLAASLCLFGVFLTFSRTGFMFLAVGGFVCFLLRPFPTLRRLPSLAAIATPILVTYLLFPKGTTTMMSTRIPNFSHLVPAVPGPQQSLSTESAFPPPQVLGAPSTIGGQPVGVRQLALAAFNRLESGRIQIYRPVWQKILDRPWGHGLNQFGVVIRRGNEIDLSALRPVYPKWSDAVLREKYSNIHNGWLNMLFEGGWPLCLAYLGYYSAVIRLALKSKTAMGIAGTAVTVALVASGLENNTLYLFYNQLLLILIITNLGRKT